MKCTEARRIIKQWKECNESVKIYYKINKRDKTVSLLIYDGRWHSYVCKADDERKRVRGRKGDGSGSCDKIEHICGNCVFRDDCITTYDQAACDEFRYNGGVIGNTHIKPNRTRGAY